jgi:hypothetical protein
LSAKCSRAHNSYRGRETIEVECRGCEGEREGIEGVEGYGRKNMGCGGRVRDQTI